MCNIFTNLLPLAVGEASGRTQTTKTLRLAMLLDHVIGAASVRDPFGAKKQTTLFVLLQFLLVGGVLVV